MTSALIAGSRILVIDDDEVIRALLSVVLGAEGYDVLVAESGDAAVRLLEAAAQEDLPCCVLTDMQMPGVSGTALAERLRHRCGPGAVLIAMSGSDARAREITGYDGFLLKPFSVEDLAAVLEKSSRTQPVSAPESVLDEAIHAKLQASMPKPQLLQLYALCLDDAEARIARMTQAVSMADTALFVREAHALKGGCGMLGATELYGLAGRMETGALACTPLLAEFTHAADRLRRMLEAHR